MTVVLSILVGIFFVLFLVASSVAYGLKHALDRMKEETRGHYETTMAFADLLNAERLAITTNLFTRAEQFKRTQPAVAAALRAEARRFEVSQTGPDPTRGRSVS